MTSTPSRFSTPLSSSKAPRATTTLPRSQSYAPPSSSSAGRTPRGQEDLLSPVSQLNRNAAISRNEQAARMRALQEERVRRLAAVSQSSAKRKLTDLEAAAVAAKTTPVSLMDKVKKMRTSSPPQRTTSSSLYQPQSAGSGASRRAVSHGTGPSNRDSGASALSAAALKHHDERHEQEKYLRPQGSIDAKDQMTAATSTDAHERYLGYSSNQQPSTPTTPPQQQRMSTASAQPLFSRYTDPSVQKTPESTTSSPFKFPGYESSESSQHGTPPPILRTPVRTSDVRTSAVSTPVHLLPRDEDGMVDLARVDSIASLETVEGDDILEAMMKFSTPRVGRHFPTEETHTASEEREIQFLRRRRLAAARRSIDMKAPVVTNQIVKTSWEFDHVLAPVSSPSVRGQARQRQVLSHEARQAVNEAEDAKAAAAEKMNAFLDQEGVDEDDDDDDDETTETKATRFIRASQWSLRRFAIMVLVGAGVLCLLDVAVPLVFSLFEPPRPYCDNNASALGESESKAVTLIDKSEYTALQPYREDCRACPLFGVCAKGVLVTCLPPLEQRNGVCVESKEVQQALEQVARSIELFVIEKARRQVCGSQQQLPPVLDSTSSGFNWNLDGVSPDRVFVMLSELRDVVLNSPFAETLMNISMAAAAGNAAAGYVFNRSLDLAMASFQKITQGGFIKMTSIVSEAPGDMLIQFSTSVAPFSCRAKKQLLDDAYVIAIVVAVFTLAGLAYHQYLTYKTERALVDRFVKEARFFLLGRSHRTERFFPANHLRDNLFDTLPNSPRDRKWLREKVWPTVATIVGEDSRVRSFIAPIHGKQMVVWEWISSSSPNVKVEQKRRLRPRRDRYSL